MSKNTAQVYMANPITTIENTDLIYVAESGTTDAAIQGSDLIAQLAGATPAQVQENAFNSGLDSGTADVYNIAVTPAITEPYNDMLLAFIPANGNIGSSPTIALNSGTAYPINNFDGSVPIFPSDISGEIPCFCIFNTLGFWQLINPITVGKYPKLVTQGVLIYYPDQGVAPNIYVATAGIDSTEQPSIPAQSGTPIVFFPANTNTGASTMNFNGIGAINIQYNGADLVGGEMVVNQMSLIFFDGTQYQLINSYASSGGSSPWIAGAGTGSAIGGDGTETCTGNYSLTYGTASCSNSAVSSFAFGNATTITSTGSYNFAYGNGCLIDNAVSGAFAFGDQATAHANYDFVMGNNNSRSGTNGQSKFVFGNGCTANLNYSFSFGDTCNVVGAHGFAFGNNANVNNNGAVCWGDSHANPVSPTSNNQYCLTFASGYYFYIDNSPTLAVSIDATSNLINFKGTSDQSFSYQTPSTGFSITIGSGVKTLILDPAGTLLAGTIVLPAAPINGQEIRFSSSQIVTGLTVSPNSGQTLSNAPTTIAAGMGFSYIYITANTNWYRLY